MLRRQDFRSCWNLAAVAFLLFTLSGCCLLPLRTGAVVGEYRTSLGLNEGSSLSLKADGTYTWSVHLTYCVPLVVANEDGSMREDLMGWTNIETGKWELDEDRIRLSNEDRQIQNTFCETEYFDGYRMFLVVREVSGIRLVSSFGKRPVIMKRYSIRNE